MSRTEFMEMHASCVTALEAYLIEAEKTTRMLAECNVEPLTLQERFRLMSQGIVENDAHSAYVGTRSPLNKAALLGYGSSD